MGSPVQVVTENGQPLSNVRDLAVSSDHGCAVTNDERIYCWGTWSFGQRGLTPVQGELPPGYATEFPHSVVRPIRAIAASTFRISGQGTSCIIDGNYDTKCWGVLVRPYPDWPGINLAPLPPGIPATTSPALVSGMGNAHRLALSRDDLCVRLQTGALRCRGVNLKGALGRAGTERTGNAQFAITQTVTTWGNPVDVLSHDAFVGCTRQTDASVRCAGSRWGGLLGNDYMPNHSGEPVQPIGLDPVRQVSVGHRHVCVLQADGRLKCWGNNDYGVMGLGHRNGSGDCWANSSGSNENVREEDDEQFYFAGVKCFQVPQEGSIQENTVYLTSGMASLCGVTGSGRIWCRGVVTSDGGNSEPRFEFDKWVNIPAP
jgi:alpha-tubulin suppressor-like RCC1 family protein